MKFSAVQLALVIILPWLAAGCRSPDPAARFIARMDRAPVEKRPKNWEHTRSLMVRPAPEAGQLAPDFSLPGLDGGQSVTRSTYQASRPLVLIFGSFT